MDWIVPGTLAEVRAQVEAAVLDAGWRAEREPGADDRWCLRPARSAAPTSWAWLVLVPAEGGVRLIAWLPDAEPTREALETALDRLQTPDALADEALLNRLRRIEGQIRGLHKMLAAGRECEAIMTQFAAVSSALRQSAAMLVSTHMVSCLREELDHGGDGSALNQKLLNILF